MSRGSTIDDGFATVLAMSESGTSILEPDDMETRLFGDGVSYGSIPSFVQASAEVRHVIPAGEDESPIPDDPSFRYEDLGLIGRGMMGEVRRVRDRDLNRTVAMKVVRGSLTSNRRLLARFIAEAQAAAQLTHPSIIPIHELGVLPDRRFFFTMKEVRGDTLRDVLRAFHGGDDNYTLAHVVGLFRKAAEAVAYAHSRGVLHRDLKPDNVMVGSFGEVLVLDWGLAKVMEDESNEDLDPIVTNRSMDAGLKTQLGTVAGTPCYMPPEQAAGKFSDVGPEADVYALGAMLYEVLVGRPPYSPSEARRILSGEATGSRPPIRMPAGLAEIAQRALQPMPEDRYSNAGGFIDALEEWLSGEQVRERADAAVTQATELFSVAEVSRTRLHHVRTQRDAQVAQSGCSDVDVLNRLSDDAEQLVQSIDSLEQEAVALVRGALAQVPDLDGGHRALAEFYRKAHERAVRRHDPRADKLLESLRTHDRGEQAGYLGGIGYLSVVCRPSPSAVFLARLDVDGRDGRVGEERALGPGNHLAVELEAGSWRVRVQAGGRQAVLPVRVDRLGFWDGRGPDGRAAPPIDVTVDSRGGVYVAPGPFRTGADAQTGAGTRDVWVDGFVVQPDVVTLSQFAVFLSSMVELGREMDAVRWASELTRGSRASLGRTADGFHVQDSTMEDLPVTRVSFIAAEAYASWVAERTGMPWRLPRELEWEKAARGVDGRAYPWGSLPAWGAAATMEVAHEPVAVDAFPNDISPYGVRGCAGNVSEWCADEWVTDPAAASGFVAHSVDAAPTRRVVRGGSFRDQAKDACVGSRRALRQEQADAAIGFRLVRSIL